MKMFNMKKGAAVLMLLALSAGTISLEMMGHPHIDTITKEMQGGPEGAAYNMYSNKICKVFNDWIEARDGLSDDEYAQKLQAVFQEFQAFVEKDTSGNKRQMLGALCARFHLFIKSLQSNRNMPSVVLGLKLKEFSDLLPASFESRYSPNQVVDALKYRKGNR